MSQTVELPRVGGPGSGLGGLWRVVVLNDDFNTFDHVAESLSRVIPGVTLADGYRLADKIHNARSIYRDLQKADVGESVWSRFSQPRELTLWYYRSLADRFCERLPGQLSSELREIVQVLEAEG